MNSITRRQIEEYSKSFKWTLNNYYWNHTLQTRKFALMIHKEVGGDIEIIEISSLLHDIGKVELLGPGHEKVSVRLTKNFLEEIKFNQIKAEKIVKCIEYEDFDFLESKILRSADSMSLLMDDTGGREWYFENILKNSKDKILKEIGKSYSEISFDFSKNFVKDNYKKLIEKYKNAN